MTREEQKQQRRMQILMGALDLFVTRGYAATKITDIAKQQSMSVGLLFHYFESKEKLYEELIRMGLEGTAYPVNQKYDSAITYFEEFTNQLLSYMKVQPYIAKMFVLMADAQQNEATPPTVRELANNIATVDQFVKIIEWGQQEGSIREGNPTALSNAFWCSIQGIAERFARHPEIPLPEAEWIIDIVKRK